MRFELAGAPHLPPERTVAGMMREVLYALVPGIVAYAWYFGPGVVIQIALASAFALALEYAVLRLRGQPAGVHLGDCTAVVTAVLFALSIPPLAPWWVNFAGMFFAIVIAKHLYGGVGHNRFNPAMVGVVVVLVSFPQILTQWLPPAGLADVRLSVLDSLYTIATGQPPAGTGWDAISRATPLDTLRTGVERGLLVSEVRQAPLFGDFGGRGWEWIANWYALGGLWLLYRRVISWHVPVAMLGTIVALTLPFYLLDPGANPVPLHHVFSGAAVLGAFFIATDPVSGCATPRGKLLFGCGVAVVTLAIRRWGAYPDGVAFAVLVLNMFAPLIDRYTRPRVFGQ